jgi:hypothetical protein
MAKATATSSPPSGATRPTGQPVSHLTCHQEALLLRTVGIRIDRQRGCSLLAATEAERENWRT